MRLQDLKVLETELDDDEITAVLVRHGLIERFIKEVIVDRVVKEELTDFEETDINNTISRFCEEKGITTNAELETFLQKNGLNKRDLAHSLLRPIAIRNYRNKKWQGEILNYYYENKELYDTMRFRMIILSNSNLAQELYFRLKDKENTWGEICKALNIEEKDISYGPIQREEIEEQIRKELESIKIGQVTKPFMLKSGFAICELIQQSGKEPSEEIREKIVSELFEKWLNTEVQKTLTQLTNFSTK